jgi:intraflagellar transport protein 74
MGTRGGMRQGTAAKGPGVGTLTEVKVSDRPMTMQGMAGMKTGGVGPKRQIYDKTYYMGELRNRRQELLDEVTRLNKEIDDIQQENKLYNSLEKRYDTLVKTVRNLEGDLADHNLATDKQRTDTRPEEVHHMYQVMESQNKQQRADVDQIFLEKRSHEDEIARMDQEIGSIARAAEDRLSELHPDQRREYEELREENGRLARDLAESRDELDQVSGRLNAEEGRLRSDLLRTRYQQLVEVKSELSERLEILDQEIQQCNLSIPEQRELLLSKVKSDNADIVQAEKQTHDLKMENERLRSLINQVAHDAQKKEEDQDQQKYEVLFTKDQEMTQFIDSFPGLKEDEERKLAEKQESITRLLENISKTTALPSDMSPDAHFSDLQEDLDFKSRQLHNAETTQQRLEADLTKREGELEKIESLDVKISMELKQVEEKMKQYQEDIDGKYENVGSMKEQGEAKCKQLEGRKKSLEARVSALKQQIGFLKISYDAKRQQLADDETAANLEAQEQKIKHFGANLYSLQSTITEKESETDFRQDKGACLDMATQINKILQEQMMRPMVNP